MTSFGLISELNKINSNINDTFIEIKPNVTKKWTYMIYFCADTRDEYVTANLDNSNNGLHLAMLESLIDMVNNIQPGSETDINIIALYDYPYTVTDPNGHAYIYDIKATADGGKTVVADWGVTNMGDSETLGDFITYCKTNYPADYYALSLVDHGRGYAGYCFDYHAPHPSFTYAIGDCLTLNEVETALSGPNSIDVIIFSTCLGGSFETAWQLMGEVDYMIGGETTLGLNQIYTSLDYVYNLSRNPNLTPREFAEMAFYVSRHPVALPTWRDWPNIALYDLTQFTVAGLGSSFVDTFDLFVESLHDELDYNITQRDFFKWIRSGMGTAGMAQSESMMVDLKDCIEKIVGNQTGFHYAEIGIYGTQLLGMLDPNPNGILINYYNLWDENHTYPAPYLQGFNFCFPDSYDMYNGFLYGTMYSGLKLNIDTRWGAFLNRLFPYLNPDSFKLKDFYEIQLFKIDPTVRLDLYYEISPTEIYHIGLNEAFIDTNKGIEVGIEGAEYMDDFYGNFMIRIPTPTSGFTQVKAVGDESFKIVVNASFAASATQDVNLTVKHIANNDVIWQETQISDINIGQALVTIISIDDTMTDFEIIDYTTTNKFGETHVMISIVIISFIMLAPIQIIKRKKLKQVNNP
ncbi:MAG: hypothetical protein FK734_16655 [Asgard group archaeon]|nr:hypothetical protein [Asgard group archaeon]